MLPIPVGHAAKPPWVPIAVGQVLAAGFVDAWRHAHPDTSQYTYWSYRFDARAQNKGWRIDYTLVSKDALALVVRPCPRVRRGPLSADPLKLPSWRLVSR